MEEALRTQQNAEPGSEGPDDRAPIFNLPTVILLFIFGLAAIYLIQTYLLSVELNDRVYVNFGFIPARYAYALGMTDLAWLWTPVTYSLLHGSISHLVFNSLWLAAFGTPVALRIGPTRFVIFWVLSAAASAFFFMGLHWGEPSLLIGASGSVSALMGSACRFVFAEGRGLRSADVHLNTRMTMIEALRNRTAFIFIIAWLAGNLLFAFGIPFAGMQGQSIAWEAHIGGFLFGFILLDLFDRRQPARHSTEL
jgi:membrane associated rhomboid family serine protease